MMLKLPGVPLASGRKNVMSMRELFCPDPLAGFEKMAGFQIIYYLFGANIYMNIFKCALQVTLK